MLKPDGYVNILHSGRSMTWHTTVFKKKCIDTLSAENKWLQKYIELKITIHKFRLYYI